MLTFVRSGRELRYGELMAVYSESNAKEAQRRFGESEGLGLQQVEQDFWAYLQQVFFRTEGAVYALWVVSGHYASVLRLEPYRDGLLISGLETHPEFRGKGYAHNLLRQMKDSLPKGTKLYSHVDKRNLPSRKVHEKAGFRRISDQAVYLDGSVDFRCHTLFLEV